MAPTCPEICPICAHLGFVLSHELRELRFSLHSGASLVPAALLRKVQDMRSRASGAPVESILSLKEPDGTPVWDRPAGIVGGEMVSLNHIEHQM